MNLLVPAVAAVVLAVSAQAQEPALPPPAIPPPPPAAVPRPGADVSTVHRHLGFALRLEAGIGYLSSSTSTINASRNGASGAFGVLIGGAVAENVILAGDLWATTMLSESSTTNLGANTTYGLGGFGLNLTYYFMPQNIYVSVSPSLTSLSVRHYNGTTNDRSNVGVGLKAGVGKEWWVGDHWGLGVAGQLFISTNEDPGAITGKFTTAGGGVAFTATYN